MRFGTTATVLHGNATIGVPSFGAVALATDVSGTLPVANGGTGVTTFTTNGIIYGNAASALLVTAQGAANTVLTANAGAPSFSATPTVSSLTLAAVTNQIVLGTTNTTTISSVAPSSSQTLTIPVIRQAENIAIRPQVRQTIPADPAGTASAPPGVMMGLAGSLTPQVTGRAFIFCCGTIANNTLGDGGVVQIRYGTGAAPANGAAVTGTTIGNSQRHFNAVANELFPFSLFGFISGGLALGTAIWADVSLGAITGGTASITDVNISLFEL